MATIGPAERARIHAIREEWLQALEAAVARLGDEIEAQARRAIAEIRASGYDARAARRIVRRVLTAGDQLTREYLREQIPLAVEYADRVRAVYDAWEAEGREAPTQVRAWAASGAREGARQQAAAGVAKLGAPLPIVAPADRLQTTPTYEAARALLAPRQVTLSAAEHRREIHREIRRQMRRLVREGARLDDAGRELVRYARDLGRASPRLVGQKLRELEEAARQVNAIGDLRDWRRWERALGRVRRYAETLKDSRGMYRELLQILDEQGPEAIDHAMHRFLGEKQRYQAERIVRTEAAAAQRAREADQIARNPRIRALVWRMSRGARRDFARRVKPRRRFRLGGRRRRGGGGVARRCICEALDGREFPPQAAAEWPRMGHPHCYCYWERVYRD